MVSWVVPVVGPIISLVAVGLGTRSIMTRGPYRADWTAVAGICFGVGALFADLYLFAMDASGL